MDTLQRQRTARCKRVGNCVDRADVGNPASTGQGGCWHPGFAYGNERTLNHFVEEATFAARTFRERNPRDLQIGIVTNNQTVDRSVFSHHIVPRSDLLFPGSACPYGPKGCKAGAIPRQWMTRLYYMAESPFLITWALDSNVANCVPNAAYDFLQSALASHLWDFDIAHPSQSRGNMYPHNWNIIYKWNVRTSNMMRDWLLLQMRRGITTDDQGTLFAAEQRARAAGGLNVGQMPNNLASCFNSNSSNQFFPRITRMLTGASVVLHGKKQDALAWCEAFNRYLGPRQMFLKDKDSKVAAITSVEQCKAAYNGRCPFKRGNGSRKPSSVVLKPSQISPKELKLPF